MMLNCHTLNSDVSLFTALHSIGSICFAGICDVRFRRPKYVYILIKAHKSYLIYSNFAFFISHSRKSSVRRTILLIIDSTLARIAFTSPIQRHMSQSDKWIKCPKTWKRQRHTVIPMSHQSKHTSILGPISEEIRQDDDTLWLKLRKTHKLQEFQCKTIGYTL